MPLLTAPDGRRLSKRDRDLDLGVLREKYAASELIGLLACAAGLTDRPEPCTPGELLSVFSPEKIPKEDITITFP